MGQYKLVSRKNWDNQHNAPLIWTQSNKYRASLLSSLRADPLPNFNSPVQKLIYSKKKHKYHYCCMLPAASFFESSNTARLRHESSLGWLKRPSYPMSDQNFLDRWGVQNERVWRHHVWIYDTIRKIATHSLHEHMPIILQGFTPRVKIADNLRSFTSCKIRSLATPNRFLCQKPNDRTVSLKATLKGLIAF